MFALEPCEWRGRGAEYATLPLLVCGVQLLSQFETVSPHAPKIRSMDQQARQRHKRRVRMVLPVANLLVEKAFVILRARVPQRVVIGMVSVNQNLPRAVAASGSSRHLRD